MCLKGMYEISRDSYQTVHTLCKTYDLCVLQKICEFLDFFCKKKSYVSVFFLEILIQGVPLSLSEIQVCFDSFKDAEHILWTFQ